MRTSSTTAIVLILLAAAVSLTPPAAAADLYAVTGQVVADDGTPLAGAYVSAYVEGANSGRAENRTDADGRYALELPAGKGWINVRYDKWNANDGRELLVDGNTTGIDFKFKTPPPKTAILAGRVTDAAGNPLSGVAVSVYQGCCYYYDGTAMSSSGSSEATPDAAPTTKPAEESPSSTSDAPPEPDARMSSYAIMPCCYDGGVSTTTDKDGHYEVATYAGPRQISFSTKGYATLREDVEAIDNKTVTLNVRLDKIPAADAVLTGRVLDAQTGLPIAGAQIYLNNLEWSRGANAESGKDGSFKLTTLPGWSQISISVWNHDYGGAEIASDKKIAQLAQSPGYYQYTKNLRLESGANELDANLIPKAKPTHVLIGYVVDADAKKGISGATVSFWNQDTGEWGSATTDKTGSYRILVNPGHYNVNAWANGYLGGADMFVLSDKDAEKRVDVKMVAGTQKYAPCDESCWEAYPQARTLDAIEPMPGSQADAKNGASADMAARGAPQQEGVTNGANNGANTFAGTGGGLPPYDEAANPADSETSAAGNEEGRPETGARVPIPGALGLVAIAGAAMLLAYARRK